MDVVSGSARKNEGLEYYITKKLGERFILEQRIISRFWMQGAVFAGRALRYVLLAHYRMQRGFSGRIFQENKPWCHVKRNARRILIFLLTSVQLPMETILKQSESFERRFPFHTHWAMYVTTCVKPGVSIKR